MTAEISSEATFRAYSTAQGHTYAKARPGYPPKLYDTIVGETIRFEVSSAEDLGVRQEWCTANTGEYAVFPVPQEVVSLAVLERIVETTSPVTRWREAHPEAVGTDGDVVRRAFLEIARLLHTAGVEEGQETLTGSVSGILLLVHKRLT